MKKHLSYEFSDCDIEVMVFALTVFPTLEIAENETDESMVLNQCTSAIQKLINHEPRFSEHELHIISATLDAVQFINQGKLNTTAEIKSECSNYLFAINKLASVFSDLFA